MNKEHQIAPMKVRLDELNLPGDLKKLNPAQCSELCCEIRKMLIHTVLRTGGHLASNLGVVELTLALHRNFDSPHDRIVWDVGHQAYVHKILTGRADRMPQLRQQDGLAGFPKPNESVHDTFITGHSSTAVSAAFGMAEAMRLSGDSTHFAVAVVGDGAMTGGLVYEGLNNAGKTKVNLIVILNDNNQAISKNVGAIAKYLSKIRSSPDYVRAKWKFESVVRRTPAIGEKMAIGLKKTKDKIRQNIMQPTIFDDLGFVYLGPVNGHDIEALDEALEVAKSYHRPVLVHVRTVKGKGFRPAEENPGEFHGVPPEHPELLRIDMESGDPEISIDECFSTVFGKALSEYANTDPDIIAVTAAMKYGTGLQYFSADHPERFYDVGIAEQHAVTFSAALASMGKKPVFAVYSTFLQRSFDQLIHDSAIANYHLVLGVDRAGIVGEDGETHQGVFDIPMLTAIPHCKIYAPATYAELTQCLHEALYTDTALTAVRYPRGRQSEHFPMEPDIRFTHIPGEEMLLVSYGRISEQAYEAMQALHEKGLGCGLLKLTTVFPLPDELFDIAQKYRKIVFFEEGYAIGGIGEIFAMHLLRANWSGTWRCRAIEEFVTQGSVSECMERLGLTAPQMAQYAEDIWHDKA